MLVAVDGGLRHLTRMNCVADCLIGDMDSIDSSSLDDAIASSTQLIRHPTEKDATDFELALLHLQKLGATRVTLLGMMGGRFDHVLANVLLLGLSNWDFNIDFFSPQGHGWVVSSTHLFEQNLAVDSELSLIPLSTNVSGVRCTGLYYPLLDATMTLGSSWGISNVVVKSAVSVSVVEGKLLVLHNSNL